MPNPSALVPTVKRRLDKIAWWLSHGHGSVFDAKKSLIAAIQAMLNLPISLTSTLRKSVVSNARWRCRMSNHRFHCGRCIIAK